MTRIRRNAYLKALIAGCLALILCGCKSELADERAAQYCECLRNAKGELTSVDECMVIMDQVKLEFENTPRLWIKFNKALEDCQN